MKQIVLTLGAIFLFANLAFGLVLESFDAFNLFMSSGVIIFTTIIQLYIELIKMKDGFKVPLYVINSFCGIIEYTIALLAKNDMSNNWFYVVLIIAIAFQLVLLSAANITSKQIN